MLPLGLVTLEGFSAHLQQQGLLSLASLAPQLKDPKKAPSIPNKTAIEPPQTSTTAPLQTPPPSPPQTPTETPPEAQAKAPRKPPRVALTRLVVRVTEPLLEYTTSIDVPEHQRLPSYSGPVPCMQRFGVGEIEVSASLGPLPKVRLWHYGWFCCLVVVVGIVLKRKNGS